MACEPRSPFVEYLTAPGSRFPIPELRGDQAVVDFMSEMEQSVNTAQRDFEAEVRADAHSGAVLSKEAA